MKEKKDIKRTKRDRYVMISSAYFINQEPEYQ